MSCRARGRRRARRTQLQSEFSSSSLSGCRHGGFGVCGTDGRDLCPPPIWTAARAQEPGKSGQPAGRSDRFCHWQPCPRRRITDVLRARCCSCQGSSTSRRSIATKPRFAQATKQMVETGDFVDIRFQDDVRYKKPVGIYWLQAAMVETASALGLPRAQVRIWLYRVPSLIGAIGAVLLTYWTALAFVTRRGAVLASLMMCSSVLLGVEARLAKTDAMLLAAPWWRRWARWRGSILSWQRGEDPVASPVDVAGDLLDRARGRHPAQGAADPDVCGADDRHAGDCRPLGGMALAAASGVGPDVASGSGAALVRRDLLARRRYIFRGLRSAATC